MSLNYSSFLFTDKISTTSPIVLDPTTENFTLTTPTSSSLSTSITIHTTTSPSHFTQTKNIIYIISPIATFLIVLFVGSSAILCILMVIKTRGTRTHPQMGNSPIQVSMSHQKIPLSDLGIKQHELGFDSISISISTSSGLVHQLQPDITSRLMTAVSTQVYVCMYVCVCVCEACCVGMCVSSCYCVGIMWLLYILIL